MSLLFLSGPMYLRCYCPPVLGGQLRSCRGLNRRGRVGLPLYSTAVLNLNALDLYSFASLSLLTFCRTKSYKKARHKVSKPLLFFARVTWVSTRSNVVCRLCLSFQSREQKNSLHALPTSHGAHAQTLLFLFLYWN